MPQSQLKLATNSAVYPNARFFVQQDNPHFTTGQQRTGPGEQNHWEHQMNNVPDRPILLLADTRMGHHRNKQLQGRFFRTWQCGVTGNFGRPLTCGTLITDEFLLDLGIYT